LGQHRKGSGCVNQGGDRAAVNDTLIHQVIADRQ
jgi:hypothetical protein